jgi:phenylpyruvate tautomerase PptA (4-oxalocrotonate tautomerase family)
MPMIDVYARPGTFTDPSALARDLAATLMEVEGVPPISLFRQNTAAFIHETTLANVDGNGDRVRVQVLTNAGALDRAKQLAAVRRLTDVVAAAAGDPGLADRTWVLLTETYDGGWGIGGHAYTNEELVGLARAEMTAGQ